MYPINNHIIQLYILSFNVSPAYPFDCILLTQDDTIVVARLYTSYSFISISVHCHRTEPAYFLYRRTDYHNHEMCPTYFGPEVRVTG